MFYRLVTGLAMFATIVVTIFLTFVIVDMIPLCTALNYAFAGFFDTLFKGSYAVPC